MQPFAAGRLEEALQAQIGEEVAHLYGGRLEHREVEILVGIEIENDAVGLVDVRERHAPIVDFERAYLHQTKQALFAVDIEIGLLALAA